MYKQFQIWIYSKILYFKYFKKGAWDQSPEFMLETISRFKSEWLVNVDPTILYSEVVSVYYKKLIWLIDDIETASIQIEKDENIVVPGYTAEVRLQEYKLIDYFADENQYALTPIVIEKKLKSISVDLIKALQRSEKVSEVRHSYYKRVIGRILYDILEHYSVFIKLAKSN